MYKLTWRIENFYMLPQKTGEFISANYKVKPLDDVNVSLHLYPYGELFSNTLGYKISIDKPEAFESSGFTKVQISFFRNGKSLFREYAINEIKFYNSFERKDIEADKFQDLFLSTDNVDFECVFIKPRSVTSETLVTYSEKTVVQIITHSHDVSIRDVDYTFSKEGKKEKHPFCNIFDKFMLCFDFHVSLKNNIVEIRKLSPKLTPLSICYKMSMFDSVTKNKPELFCDKYTWKACSENDPWNIPFNIDTSLYKHFQSLCCDIIVSEGNITKVHSNSKSAPHKQIHFDNSKQSFPTLLMKQMHQTKMFSDVVFQVGSHQFPAHKCVLAYASEVFATMFKSKMVEEATNVINITDIDKNTIEKMLNFIYTGDVDIENFENLTSLYFVANKYQILELKELCSLHFKKALSVDNCLEILKYADMHQDSCLKDAACSFVRNNRKAIPISTWKTFTTQSNMDLVADIMFNVCQQP